MKNNLSFSARFRAISIITIFALVFVMAIEVLHAGHEEQCHDEDCAVCLILQIIHSTNKISAGAKLSSVNFNSFYYINILIFSAFLIVPATLVKQKIKLVI